MELGDISVAYIDLIIKAMTEVNDNAEDILQQFSLDSVNLASPDARVSIPKFMRLGHACIKKSKTPWFGLVMGRVTCPSNLGLTGLLADTAKDLNQACQQLATYEILNSYNIRGQSTFHIFHKPNKDRFINNGQGVLKFYSIKPYNEFNYFIVDSVMAGWSQVISQLLGRDDAIEKICFEFSAPSYEKKYQDYFNCDVLFDQPNNYLILKKEALSWPCINACSSTSQMLKRYADAELEKVRLGLSFNEKVSRVIGPLLDGTTPTLEQVSEQLNMAPWTVRRKLVEEGGSFQQTLNNTRKELSISYVRDTLLTLGEIAYLLGFGSPPAFQRAFKRWTGIAPGQFRKKN